MSYPQTKAETVQIHCIRKQDRQNPYERILAVGGRLPDGTRWTRTQQEAIELIENGQYNFFVHVQGKSVWVEVAESRFGNKYLKTENDGEDQNNLLSLRECP